MRKGSQILIGIVLVGMIPLAYVAKTGMQIRQLNMVEVLHKDGDRLYTVSIPARFNPGKLDQSPTIRLCNDGDDLPLKAGMVMRVFQYKQMHDCLRIDGDTFVGYLRDAQNNVVDKFGNQLFAGGD